MPITEFKIKKEVLVNTGNYENTKVSHEMTYRLDDQELPGTEPLEEAQEHVTNRIDKYLKNQIRLIKSARGR